MSGSLLGAAVRRTEDPRFLTGRGCYLADLDFAGQAWMVPVRSPVAHGRLAAIDSDGARALPGVVGVFTAEDLDLEDLPPGVRVLPKGCARPVVAREVVRFVGEVVAVVVAETPHQAADAAEAVWAEIEPLPAVATIEAALAEGAPLVFPDLDSNVVWRTDHEPVPEIFDEAEVVVSGVFRNQRLAAVPLEPNSAAAVPEGDRITVWAGSQNAFAHQRAIARSLGIDPHRLRVRVPDLGGGFGAKIYTYPEQVLVAALAQHLGRPVRWQESRSENLVAMCHGRGQEQRVELGARADGRLVGLRATIFQDAGAYPAFGAYLPFLTRLMAAGVYDIPFVDVNSISVVTNTTPLYAYRGAGRPQAAALIERAMDLLAAELALDPVELRRRNLIETFPHTTATGAEYDSGAYRAALDRALELADYERLRQEQAERRSAGSSVQLGLGVSAYVEVTAPLGQREWGSVEVRPDGSAEIRSGTSSHGQGHETAFAQLLSGLLAIPAADVTVVQGDTDRVPRGGGTMASRSLQLGGSAVVRAGEAVLVKARTIVAHRLEASVDDVVLFEDGRIGVTGVPDSGLRWDEIAALAGDPALLPDGLEPGLAAQVDFEAGAATFPFGAHVSVVEVDTETGEVRIVRHVAVDDCGRILNPLLVDGQVHGGIAQGIGQAVFEEFRYDRTAQPLTTNLTTYLVPTASVLPPFTVDHTETPSPHNPLGAKGIGESGTIGATPAVHNAVVDALGFLGVRHLDMPATPSRVWEALANPA